MFLGNNIFNHYHYVFQRSGSGSGRPILHNMSVQVLIFWPCLFVYFNIQYSTSNLLTMSFREVVFCTTHRIGQY